MEKELFIDVLKHYSKSSESEALNIVALKEKYPYSQVLHALAARLSKDHSLIGFEQALQSAAIYAGDRVVLKQVMTADSLIAGSAPKDLPVANDLPWKSEIKPDFNTDKKEHQGSSEYPTAEVPKVEPVRLRPRIKPAPIVDTPVASELIEEVSMPPVVHIATGDYEESSVADEVMNDLERLHQLKHNFEVSYIANKATRLHDDLALTASAVVEQDEPTYKSKRERIIELARALDSDEKETSAPIDTSRFGTHRKQRGETIIDEIVSGKQEIEPESLKQKEQLQMIDEFIKTQPSISNKDKVLPAPEGDLATIKTGEFTDNIVSETLVEILIKQGKKDKAIEVLKKLIWKFPQKKAYFAAQIEDLKK